MKNSKKKRLEYSKKVVSDIRILLWITTLGGLLLAFYCVHNGYVGELGWITSLVGLAWAAHGTVSSFYLNMAKSDHREGGITYTQALHNQKMELLNHNNNSEDIPNI